MKLNKYKLIYIWPQLKYLKIQLKIPQSDYINFKNYGEKTRQHSYQVWSCARARTEVNFRSVFVYRAVSGAGYKHG